MFSADNLFLYCIQVFSLNANLSILVTYIDKDDPGSSAERLRKLTTSARSSK